MLSILITILNGLGINEYPNQLIENLFLAGSYVYKLVFIAFFLFSMLDNEMVVKCFDCLFFLTCAVELNDFLKRTVRPLKAAYPLEDDEKSIQVIKSGLATKRKYEAIEAVNSCQGAKRMKCDQDKKRKSKDLQLTESGRCTKRMKYDRCTKRKAKDDQVVPSNRLKRRKTEMVQPIQSGRCTKRKADAVQAIDSGRCKKQKAEDIQTVESGLGTKRKGDHIEDFEAVRSTKPKIKKIK